MDRRKFIGSVGLGLVPVQLSRAQRSTKIPRLGILAFAPTETPELRALRDALDQGLREHGYVDGKNIAIEYLSAGGKFEQIPVLASELARLNVDVIVVGPTQVALAVQRIAPTIPIVAATLGDPVQDGLAVSLARPGGNVTGLTIFGPELVLKRLEILKNVLPTASRIAALWHSDLFAQRSIENLLGEAEAAARFKGVVLQPVEVREPGDLERAFSDIARGRPDALLDIPSNMLFLERRRVVDLAAKHQLPSIHWVREFVVIGGLMSYGPSAADLFRRSAAYVDKILKGAKPGDLPIEQPTKFELVINVKTAKALGLVIPQPLLLRTDEVIQ